MGDQQAETINFCGTRLLLVREADVHRHLSIGSALANLREALSTAAAEEAVNRPRTRIDSREKGRAWLHTLRAGLAGWGVAGGKDYTSLGFETPAMWASVIDTSTGLPLAFIEADFLSRIRTAAVAGLATDLLAPPNPLCLAHFGAGKIAEYLVKAVLHVRPSIRKVFLVRKRSAAGAPEWLSGLGGGVEGFLVNAEEALAEADMVTTATSSPMPVIPAGAALPRLRHLNLIGSNHLKRKEIDVELARRCLPPAGFLVADDPGQAEAEAGDFVELAAEGALRWSEIPTLAELVADPSLRERAREASLTAFKSVGIGLMDLIVAEGLRRRLQVATGPPRTEASRSSARLSTREDRMSSFLDQLDKAMGRFAKREAFVSGSVSKTFSEVATDIAETEDWLRATGCKKGDRIAALTYNCAEAVILEWATYRLGGTWIGIPTLARDLDNIEQLLDDFEPKLLLLEPGALGLFQVETLGALQAFPCEELELPAHLDPSRFRLLRRTGKGRTESGFTVGGEPVARIRYTSGASGAPKAIAYTGRTIAAILDNILQVINPAQEDTVVHGLPSVWASGSLIAPAFCRGGKNVLLPRWDLSRFVESVNREEQVLTLLVPGQVADLAQYTEQSGAGWARSLSRVLVAGGPAPISALRRAKEALPEVRFFITLGQTEASFPITLHNVENSDVDPDKNHHPFVSLGGLTQPYEKSEVDPETGELKLRGDSVAAGNWEQGCFVPFGQPHRTGDLVAVETTGALRYLGRGESLESVRQGWPAPEAIEALIREYPGAKRARVDSFMASGDGVCVDVTVEPQTVVIRKETLVEFFNHWREAANLSAVSLGSLRFGEIEVTMSGKIKRKVKRDA